jgi:hypothetical protein
VLQPFRLVADLVTLVAISFARREDFAHGGTGIPSLRSGQALPVRTAKMAVPRLGCGPAALDHSIPSISRSRRSAKWRRNRGQTIPILSHPSGSGVTNSS